MPRRTESTVFFDLEVRADALLDDVARTKPEGASMTSAMVTALGIALRNNPSMNRFAVGGRLYQRHERLISFSMKRSKGEAKAKLSTVKMAFGHEDEQCSCPCS